MKKYRALHSCVVAVVVVALGAIVGTAAWGYQTFNDHRMLSGVWGNQYWLDGSAVTNNENAVVAGVGKWNGTGRVAFQRTYTKANSHLDFYSNTSPSYQYCAVTALYVNTTEVNPFNSNWYWARVYIDPALKNAATCGSSGHRGAILAHEQGHAMGLAHAVHADRLMYDKIASTNVENPTADDINGINHLYW